MQVAKKAEMVLLLSQPYLGQMIEWNKGSSTSQVVQAKS